MDFFEAATRGKVKFIQTILAEAPDAKALDLDGAALNVLQWWGSFTTSDKPRPQCLKLLLDAGADPNAIDRRPGPGEGSSLLSYAVRSRNVEAVQMLLEAGADPSRKDKLGHTIADEAGIVGEPAILAALQRAGAVRTAFATVGQAAFHGDVERVRALLAAGADPFDNSEQRSDPLSLAAISGQLEVCRVLLEAGLDVEGGEDDGCTPLIYAASGGHVEVVRLLLAHGADAKAKWHSNTPLKAARGATGVPKGRRQEMLALLEKYGERVDPAFAALNNLAKASGEPAFAEALRHVAGLLGGAHHPWKKRKGVYQFARFNQNALPQAQTDARTACFCLVRNQETALLFPSGDKYIVIAGCGTDTNMRGLDAHDLVLWLRDMERENPFDLTACGFDNLAGVFRGPVANAKFLAERMLHLCPDLEGPAEALAEDLQRTREFGFWWD